MRIFAVLLVLVLSGISISAKAEAYEPGTIGYVFEACKVSFEIEKTADAFQKTYCGRFLAGLFMGSLTSNWILLGRQENDPCKEARDIAYEHINSRNCLYQKDGKWPDQGTDISAIYYSILNEWIAYLEKSGKKEEAFSQPVTKLWRYFTRNNQLCKYTETNAPMKVNKIIVNPDLSRDLKEKYQKFYEPSAVTLDEIYNGCNSDIHEANDSQATFASSPCGAEILGYLAGLYSTKGLQDYPPKIEGVCKPVIDDLYKNLDITARYCYSEDMDILAVGKLFIRTVDKLRLKAAEEKRDLIAEKTPYGSVMSSVAEFYDNCEKRFRN